MKLFILKGFLLLPLILFSQTEKRALFIGNSYTYMNSLPELINQIAISKGNSLIYYSIKSYNPQGLWKLVTSSLFLNMSAFFISSSFFMVWCFNFFVHLPLASESWFHHTRLAGHSFLWSIHFQPKRLDILRNSIM